MTKRFKYNPEDDDNVPATFVRMKPGGRERAAQNRAVKKEKPDAKASFEANPDVQRWLSLQSIDGNDKPAKPAFNPSLVSHRRDGQWILSSLTPFYNQELITDVLHEAHSGKEANVYCCQAHPSTGVEFLAVKIYRPRMFRSLRNDAVYRFSRVQRDEQGQAIHNLTRRGSAATRKTERGRAAQVASWIEYEYMTQRLLYQNGADVPKPFAQVGNAVLMEYIGALDEPASRLSDVILEPEEAQTLFDCVMRNIQLALVLGRIHGDLSAFNILYWEGEIKLIDFAQAVDPFHNSDVFSLLLRDIERTCQYFAQYGIQADARKLAHDTWVQMMGPIPDFV